MKKKPITSWPYRQHDPRWKANIMWDRRKVIDIGIKYNGLSRKEAGSLLFNFKSGNTIETEGCLLTCLSMVLCLLHHKDWTPDRLNDFAQENLYYSQSGLSMTTLYADLVGEASKGKVQLFMKEEYSQMKVFPSSSIPLQAYLSLSYKERSNCAVMIKVGTHDDTFASHFVLADPENAIPNQDDITLLDPYQPLRSKRLWSLSDSCKRLCKEKNISLEWSKNNISFLQIAGIWIFCKWQLDQQRVFNQPLIKALSILSQ